ncbi:unnamed protein product [Pieris brassicae]|uniref:Uncharacterized protein n=1 Tax=Pieris brassicae TaxID=7116 RepID=A0A9P0TMQ5_PIEBR|nr:unnamed protein product [Pieris brassicae]
MYQQTTILNLFKAETGSLIWATISTKNAGYVKSYFTYGVVKTILAGLVVTNTILETRIDAMFFKIAMIFGKSKG